MNRVVTEVLGDLYSVEIVSDNAYSILFLAEVILTRGSINKLEAHWREELAAGLEILQRNKIKIALSKV